ncbi:uncharacterized protein E0L32_006122 [Thyridium curvatum]|uniref:Uncharacterized protein n=1 Tax=Thyridium curvatum TaxID=1093900 RepID=A0A507ATT4_9PEZI|nr:uncharacterized protein E0L32_006122 [Thyridium curvatum]TPX13392.1 hypothetical protein E0L32_006122 [Thyridium curvatum]
MIPEPVTTILSLVNGSVTFAQSISALASAPDEVKVAVNTLATVQAEIQRATDLRDRAFDVTSADAGESDTFVMVQKALRNAQQTVKVCVKTLNTESFEDKVPTTTMTDRKKKKKHSTTRVRLTWVFGGKSTYDANMQSLQIHHHSLVHATAALEERLKEMGQNPPPFALPFGDFEEVRNSRLGLPSRDDIAYWVGPRRSGELLAAEEDDQSVASSSDSVKSVKVHHRDQGSQNFGGTGHQDISVLVINATDGSEVDNTFLDKLKGQV